MSAPNPTIPQADLSPYGYVPHEGVAIVFLLLFGLSTILHATQAVYFRMWWLLPTACLCGIGEVVGWSGRLWSSLSPTLGDPYMMQITTTIISPTPLLAVNFIVLSRIITRLGPSYSRLTPKSYTTIFLSCDLIALVVQGAGGGIAASSTTRASQNLGGNIMLGGIVFQFVAICAYTACGVDFVRNYTARKSVRPMISSAERGLLDTRLKLMLAALAFSTLVLLIRSIYRTVELADGWTGKVITTEVYFNVLDGGMVILAIYTMNIAHPGLLLMSRQSEPEDREQIHLKQYSSSTASSFA